MSLESGSSAGLAPTDGPQPLGRRLNLYRLRGAWLMAPFLGIVLVALWLSPRPRGYGTHRQLGLPACSFLVHTGLPCPTCGMTTCMTLMARGRVVEAFGAHPFGVVLFVALAALAGVGAAELVTGRDVLARLHPSVWWCFLGLAGLLAGWAWKLLAGFFSGTLPIR